MVNRITCRKSTAAVLLILVYHTANLLSLNKTQRKDGQYKVLKVFAAFQTGKKKTQAVEMDVKKKILKIDFNVLNAFKFEADLKEK